MIARRTTGGYDVVDGDRFLEWSRRDNAAWMVVVDSFEGRLLHSAIRRHELFLLQTHDLSALLPSPA